MHPFLNVENPPLLILASGSPRRQHLLKEAGFDFFLDVRPTDETVDAKILPEEVPIQLAVKKAAMFLPAELRNQVVLTADTVVILDGEILNKPQDSNEAYRMLSRLSGKKHTVVTGVCLKDHDRIHTFSDKTEVHFRVLTENEIKNYIQVYQPFDKAGAYGAQEFMGMIGIDRMEGSYFNVMGLPIHKVYSELEVFLQTRKLP